MVLPLGLSAPPLHRRPYATAVLLAAAVAVFVHVARLREAAPALFCSDLTESARALAASADTVQGFVCRWGAIPDELQHGRRPVTVLTSVLVHVGWLHLLANLAFLAAFGPRVEDDLGPAGLLGVFFGSAVLGAAAHVLLVPNLTAPSVGASGGVAGVLGAHLLLARGAQVRVLVGPVPMRLPTSFVIAAWAVLQLAGAAVLLSRAEYPVGTSYDVHAVGFVVGLVAVGLALAVRPGLRRWTPPTGDVAPAVGPVRAAGAARSGPPSAVARHWSARTGPGD